MEQRNKLVQSCIQTNSIMVEGLVNKCTVMFKSRYYLTKGFAKDLVLKLEIWVSKLSNHEIPNFLEVGKLTPRDWKTWNT